MFFNLISHCSWSVLIGPLAISTWHLSLSNPCRHRTTKVYRLIFLLSTKPRSASENVFMMPTLFSIYPVVNRLSAVASSTAILLERNETGTEHSTWASTIQRTSYTSRSRLDPDLPIPRSTWWRWRLRIRTGCACTKTPEVASWLANLDRL